MPIRLTCRHCGKGFSAWDDLVGKPVQCPKCKQLVVVPDSALSPTEKPPAPASAPRPPAPPAARLAAPSSPARRTVKVTPGPRPPDIVASGRAAGTNVPQDGAAASPVAPPTGAEVAPCPNCNAPMPLNDDLCDACGYHLVLRKVLDTEGVARRNDATGLERLMKKQLSRGETPENTLFWAQIVAGCLLLVVCSMCFGIYGLLAAGGAVVAYVGYRIATRGRRQAAGGAINQDPVVVLVWSAILVLQRAVGWRLLEWGFARVRVLTLQDPAFGDEDLAELDHLSEFEAIDLEGTQISDAGLAQLESLKKLRFLVLRRTRVTAGGVTQLQGKLRRAWIWQ